MKIFGLLIEQYFAYGYHAMCWIVIDDTIVVLENIIRHMELGEPPMKAAFDGAREIGFTVSSMTVSLVAVFIPILLMERHHRATVLSSSGRP